MSAALATRDSDNDGVLDAAEDPDDDGLSNLGEQRFRTSPTNADSDGDGTSDWREDSDRNGRRDGREQDRRRVPSGVRPSLRTALYDLPLRAKQRCHTLPEDALLHPCVFGDPRGKVRITLFGDSHALQWLPALERAARTKGWRVVSITKSACPAVQVRVDRRALRGDAKACRIWRARAERWIRTHRQDLVVVANSRAYRLLDSRGKLMSRSGSGRRVAAGSDADPRPDALEDPAARPGRFARARPERTGLPSTTPHRHLEVPAVAKRLDVARAGSRGAAGGCRPWRHVPLAGGSGLSLRPVPGDHRQGGAVARAESHHADLLPPAGTR